MDGMMDGWAGGGEGKYKTGGGCVRQLQLSGGCIRAPEGQS